MKQTILTLVMATLCLSFSYGQTKLKCPVHTSSNCPDTCMLKNYRYGITGFKPAYKPGIRIIEDKFDKSKILMARNLSLTRLFAIALGAGTAIGDEQIVLKVSDPKKLDKLYCYKLMVPAWQRDNFYSIMQQILNREFPVYMASTEYKNNKCYMVIRERDNEF